MTSATMEYNDIEEAILCCLTDKVTLKNNSWKELDDALPVDGTHAIYINPYWHAALFKVFDHLTFR